MNTNETQSQSQKTYTLEEIISALRESGVALAMSIFSRNGNMEQANKVVELSAAFSAAALRELENPGISDKEARELTEFEQGLRKGQRQNLETVAVPKEIQDNAGNC